MRALTVKQKRLLATWLSEDDTISCVEDLDNEQWTILENINNTEILYQNVNRFIGDWVFREKYS